MNGRGMFDVNLAVAGAVIGLVVALAFGGTLMLIEKPRAVTDGLNQASLRLDRIEVMLSRPSDPYPDPPNAVCQGDPTLAAGAMQKAIETHAAEAKINLANLTVAPGVPDGASLGLVPVSMQFEARGGYDDVLGLLRAMSRSQPEVFVNTVELKTKTTEVALKFNGRFFCSTSALL